MISNSKSDAISDVKEKEAIGHGREDGRVEQRQLDMGRDMGVGVGARRMGMDADMDRDHDGKGMGASTGMDKMSMSKMSSDMSHVCVCIPGA